MVEISRGYINEIIGFRRITEDIDYGKVKSIINKNHYTKLESSHEHELFFFDDKSLVYRETRFPYYHDDELSLIDPSDREYYYFDSNYF